MHAVYIKSSKGYGESVVKQHDSIYIKIYGVIVRLLMIAEHERSKGRSMVIKFSRHAKRRAKLYGISETILTHILKTTDLPRGEHEILKDVPGFKYPLKIVVSCEDDLIIIITNYPLKKGRKK